MLGRSFFGFHDSVVFLQDPFREHYQLVLAPSQRLGVACFLPQSKLANTSSQITMLHISGWYPRSSRIILVNFPASEGLLIVVVRSFQGTENRLAHEVVHGIKAPWHLLNQRLGAIKSINFRHLRISSQPSQPALFSDDRGFGRHVVSTIEQLSSTPLALRFEPTFQFERGSLGGSRRNMA